METVVAQKSAVSAEAVLNKPEELSYSEQMTKAILPNRYLGGETFLDIGCGQSTALARLLVCRGGGYTPCDIHLPTLEELQKKLVNERLNTKDLDPWLVEDISCLSFEDKSFDFSHVRQVIAHIHSSKVDEAVSEAFRVVRRGAYFLEMDWSDVVPCFEASSYFSEFIAEVRSFAGNHGIDLNFGRKLNAAVHRVLESQASRILIFESQRMAGNYSKEYIEVCKSMIHISGKTRDLETKSRFEDFAEQFGKHPVVSRPPKMYSVIAERFKSATS